MSVESIELSHKLVCADEPIKQRKIFAKPFRIVMKKTADQTVTWIEVQSLEGLRTVCNRISTGELIPVDSFSTLDRQLWGHLAEHVGFLRYEGPADEFSAGIQPAGESFGSLMGDLTELFGSSTDVLSALSEMRDQLRRESENTAPHVESGEFGKYVKPDGVNLTPDGERILADVVGATEIDLEADNAAVLMNQSEPGLSSEEMDQAVSGSDGLSQQEQGMDGLGGAPV